MSKLKDNNYLSFFSNEPYQKKLCVRRFRFRSFDYFVYLPSSYLFHVHIGTHLKVVFLSSQFYFYRKGKKYHKYPCYSEIIYIFTSLHENKLCGVNSSYRFPRNLLLGFVKVSSKTDFICYKNHLSPFESSMRRVCCTTF